MNAPVLCREPTSSDGGASWVKVMSAGAAASCRKRPPCSVWQAPPKARNTCSADCASHTMAVYSRTRGTQFRGYLPPVDSEAGHARPPTARDRARR